MFGVEAECCLKSVLVVGEVVMLLRNVGQEDFEAVAERSFVISVFFGDFAAAVTTLSAFSWSPGLGSRSAVIFMWGPMSMCRSSMERMACAPASGSAVSLDISWPCIFDIS